jgi:plasmid stability protein
MAALVIKKLPDPIHKALQIMAKINHRSMTQEVVAALEDHVFPPMDRVYTASDLPVPVKPLKPISNAMVQKSKREGML